MKLKSHHILAILCTLMILPYIIWGVSVFYNLQKVDKIQAEYQERLEEIYEEYERRVNK